LRSTLKRNDSAHEKRHCVNSARHVRRGFVSLKRRRRKPDGLRKNINNEEMLS
jgi:hypothetical protein